MPVDNTYSAPKPGPLAQAVGSTGAGPGGNIAGAASPAPAPAAAPPAGQPAPPYNPYDFTSDPLYQRIIALGQLRIDQANATAIREDTQSIIDYGDPDLAKSLGLGDAAAAAAANNPFSVIAQL